MESVVRAVDSRLRGPGLSPSGPYLRFFCLRWQTLHTFKGVFSTRFRTNITTRNSDSDGLEFH